MNLYIRFFCGIDHARICAFICTLVVACTVAASAQLRSDRDNSDNGIDESAEDEIRSQTERAEYDLLRLKDPATGVIPKNIRSRELQFASRASSSLLKTKAVRPQLQNSDWVSRGPFTIGGRTKALGIDIANENIILAGGTTGGMWRSTDRGASWHSTTPVSELPATSCLAQDTRTGKTNTWYYGSGEFGANTGGYPIWLNEGDQKWGDYYGNGIYKSIDNGLTWTLLTATTSDSIGTLVQPFNFVNKIALDLSRESANILYAAIPGGIERSSDGGTTWTLVLGDFPNGASSTDVTVCADGIVYAAIASNYYWKGMIGGALPSTSTKGGLFRSVDGIHWVDISPAAWSSNLTRVYLASAPTNSSIVYFAADSIVTVDQNTRTHNGVLWKYNYISGDGSGTGGRYDFRSENLIEPYMLSPKPDDENTLFLGGVSLLRTRDGFASPGQANVSAPHVDHQTIAYFPSNPAAMIIGTDGGIFLTENNLANQISWTSLNNGYVTSQFYTIAIDHATPGDQSIVGGLQDNFTNFTNTSDPASPWVYVNCCDGASCAIADGRTSYYVSSQQGFTYRKVLDGNGFEVDRARIDPVGSTKYAWINPFALDQSDNNRMYFAGGSFLWRNDDVTSIPLGSDLATKYGWIKLTKTLLHPIDSVIHTPLITAIATSKSPARRVYFGTSDGRIFRIDSANIGDPGVQQVWEAKGFPALSFVSSIAVDLSNADNAIVAFANYNVQSLFATSDGGTSWTPVGGTLEEYPDGSGSGPSCRNVAILHSGNGVMYFAATSSGLYSTTRLKGMSTEWTLEGSATIGHSIVNMIDTRESDGMVVAATCGRGAFSTHFDPISKLSNDQSNAFSVQSSPNPSSPDTRIEFNLPVDQMVSLCIYDVRGIVVRHLLGDELRTAGSQHLRWDRTNDNAQAVSAGVYLLHIQAGQLSAVCKLSVVE